MKVRKRFIIALVLLSSPALADDNISIRPMGNGRWLIEDGVGRDIGTVRSLTDHTLIIEDMTGRDLGTVRDDQDIDLDDLCGESRAALTCIIDGDDDD
jgi:hypothetical protein